MARTNTRAENLNRTHEGAKAAPKQSAELELRRTVLSCLLFEDTFYEKGSDIAGRLKYLVAEVDPATVAEIAIQARNDAGLRHVPLFLCRELARRSKLKAETLSTVIQRADELAEFVSMYWADGRRPLSAQVKRGLALAFQKFSPYALAKYNRDDKVKLRDVLFLCHAKPKDEEQAAVWRKLVDKTLEPPDTWEVALSAGKDKKETWTRLLTEKKLGALALLRNLRNMELALVNRDLIAVALREASWRGVLPWQFISAAKSAPWAEPYLDEAMRAGLSEAPRLPGSTGLLVDVSGSMDYPLAGKGDRTRLDAASALAILLRETCDNVNVWTFSERLVEVPARRGFALAEVISTSQGHGGTYLARAVAEIVKRQTTLDRLIVITDEQSHDGLGAHPYKNGYLINVAPYKPGLDLSGGWVRINGWSERVADWIRATEAQSLHQ